jgi:hypothetical protein
VHALAIDQPWLLDLSRNVCKDEMYRLHRCCQAAPDSWRVRYRKPATTRAYNARSRNLMTAASECRVGFLADGKGLACDSHSFLGHCELHDQVSAITVGLYCWSNWPHQTDKNSSRRRGAVNIAKRDKRQTNTFALQNLCRISLEQKQQSRVAQLRKKTNGEKKACRACQFR